jgi:spore coat polysaccharide biosynthesis protein SpsF (cytidylyltransferase family)
VTEFLTSSHKEQINSIIFSSKEALPMIVPVDMSADFQFAQKIKCKILKENFEVSIENALADENEVATVSKDQ